jgi:hypothetical protein
MPFAVICVAIAAVIAVFALLPSGQVDMKELTTMAAFL